MAFRVGLTVAELASGCLLSVSHSGRAGRVIEGCRLRKHTGSKNTSELVPFVEIVWPAADNGLGNHG